MKYYVYAGYYENFISGHKLPKPYTLRDEFKTFDEALDYVWENWEDDDIFFTEDVIDDAIDNGVINDENWEDYLMEESKKSARKSIKIGDVVKNENRDDLFGLVYEVKGGRITMYPIDKDTHTYNTRFSFEGNAIDYEVVNFKVTPIEESKKSARKSIKESLNFKKDYVVEVMGGTYWFKPFYWDFDEFRNDLLIASEEEGFTYYITEESTSSYRINLESNDGFYNRYDITFEIIPKSNKATAKELNNYLN